MLPLTSKWIPLARTTKPQTSQILRILRIASSRLNFELDRKADLSLQAQNRRVPQLVWVHQTPFLGIFPTKCLLWTAVYHNQHWWLGEKQSDLPSNSRETKNPSFETRTLSEERPRPHLRFPRFLGVCWNLGFNDLDCHWFRVEIRRIVRISVEGTVETPVRHDSQGTT